eukprot:3245316-Amphidinium_carterae.1
MAKRPMMRSGFGSTGPLGLAILKLMRKTWLGLQSKVPNSESGCGHKQRAQITTSVQGPHNHSTKGKDQTRQYVFLDFRRLCKWSKLQQGCLSGTTVLFGLPCQMLVTLMQAPFYTQS